MTITTNIHNVDDITIAAPTQLERSKAWVRDFTFTLADGSTFQITAFSDEKTNLATKEALA